MSEPAAAPGAGHRAAAASRGRRTAAGTREIDAETALGEVFMRSLLREQLVLAIRVLVALALTVGLLPLLFHLFPSLGDVRSGRCRSPGCCSGC